MVNKKDKISVIDNLSEKLSLVKGVRAIYLFGSCLTGKTHKNSDIDICIITDGADETRDGLAKIDYSDKFDVVLFEDLPLQMQFRILKEGKVLKVNDIEYLWALKIRVMQEYFDFKPFLVKFYKEKFGCTIN